MKPQEDRGLKSFFRTQDGFMIQTNLDWPLAHLKAHSPSEDDPEVKRSTNLNAIIQSGTKPTSWCLIFQAGLSSKPQYLKLKETLKCLVLKRKELSSTINTRNPVIRNMGKAFKQKIEDFAEWTEGKCSRFGDGWTVHYSVCPSKPFRRDLEGTYQH